jgi:hypothetical protein
MLYLILTPNPQYLVAQLFTVALVGWAVYQVCSGLATIARYLRRPAEFAPPRESQRVSGPPPEGRP